MTDLSETLAASDCSGYVVAPAGFGKTHLIAVAVSRSSKRQLVLTHTYAGVNVLRRKMRELKVRSQAFHIDTIASWALRLSLSYPATSGWTSERPSGEEWSILYKACSVLLDRSFIRRILRASYTGFYVDEYQDCSVPQHELVLKLARDLPCRLLGDPMQGIFDFNGEAVDWKRDVCSAFESVGELRTPHRWNRAGTPAIGTWLAAVRRRLEHKHPIDLTEDLPHGVVFVPANGQENIFQAQISACRYLPCGTSDTVVAIHKGSMQFKSKCHVLAKSLGGMFSSIEEIEGRALFSFIEKISTARTDSDRLTETIKFAVMCMTAVRDSLPAPTVRGEHFPIRKNTRNPELARCANSYLADTSSVRMAEFFTALKTISGVAVTRGDLFNRMMGVLRKHALNPQITVAEAAEKFHAEFRHKGRLIGRRKIIGTTLLVKGLEFDHAIVLDAESLSRKELYVAFTRGAKSLTVISSSPVLNPTD
jgi:DNA helicase-2/ATP-dependent DNA helicase PcrA